MNGDRRALIIANDQYENEGLRQLRSPAADADALGRVLGDPHIGGFDVRVIRNEPAHVISTYVEDLFSEGRPDDVLLLHFSCHGLKSESGELFFAGRNTRPNRLGSTALSADFVQRCMRASRSRSIVLLLDCCYGGAFSQGVAVRASGDLNVLDSFPGGKLGGGRGRAVISASSSMEYAFEGDRLADEQGRSPSVFTSALVEGLATGDADRDEDGWVSLNELYDYVFDRVRAQNPNQTPSRDVEMQGELYLARSRRRRIRPQPIPADLRAAMTDANMFSRLGAVTELRGRLLSDNLPVATGAYEALQEIAGTDIQYVAEAAAAALREVEIKPAERELHFGTVSVDADPGARVIRLLGPPLARACTFQTSEGWIRPVETADGIAVSVDARRVGVHRGSVTLKGPTGEVVIPVEVEVHAVTEAARMPAATPERIPAVAAPPVDAPAAEPPVPAGPAVAVPSQAEPPGVEDVPEQGEEPVQAAAVPGAAARPAWWLLAALAAGAVVLIYLNLPGSSESRMAWSDSTTDWHVYRRRDDPFILAAFLGLAGTFATVLFRGRAGVALGVVAGSGVFLAQVGTIYVAGELAHDELGSWIVSAVIGAGIAAMAFLAVKPKIRLVTEASRPALAFVLAGGPLLVASPSVTYNGVSFISVSKGVGLLGPLIIVALGLLALAGADRESRSFIATVTGTVVVLGALDLLPAWTYGQLADAMLGLAGYALVLTGMIIAASRPTHRATRPLVETRPSARTWMTAIGLGAVALLLLYANGWALADGQKLWYDSYQGSPELLRRSYDGSLYAASAAVAAAFLTLVGGRVAAYALGVVAGVAALFVSMGVVVLGGGLAYGDGAVSAWTVSLVAAAVMLLGVAVAFGRRRSGGKAAVAARFRRPAALPAALLAVGFVGLLAIQFVAVDGAYSAAYYGTALVLLLPLVPTVLGVLALVSSDADLRRAAVGAAVAYSLLIALAAIYPASHDVAPRYFVGMLAGHLVVAIAVMIDLVNRSRRPDTDSPDRNRSASG